MLPADSPPPLFFDVRVCVCVAKGDAVRSALPVSGIYGLKPSKQVAPLLKIYQDALKAVKEPKYSALPHYNSATAQPTPPVSVDPSTGCEN